ncbi:MAG: hypothetical protein J0L58_19315 [Burkholderiales bacterium]|nr:hypothetical protein [Burkholderiales bacterium]
MTALQEEVKSLGWQTNFTLEAHVVKDMSYRFMNGDGLETSGTVSVDAHAFAAFRKNTAGTSDFAIVFTGTEGGFFPLSQDWQSDLDELGFTQSYLALRHKVYEWLCIAAAQKESVDRIFFTGHSLGGAVAQAALLDIIIDQSDSIWLNPVANQFQENLLEKGGRLIDFIPSDANAARLTLADIEWVRNKVVSATFGAPSLEVDSIWNGLDLNQAVIGSKLRDQVFQFEHVTVPLGSRDPVAALGEEGQELGTRIAIDLNAQSQVRYTDGLTEYMGATEALPYILLHKMQLYRESVLAASLGSQFTISPPGSSESPLLPQNEVGTVGNETLINGANMLGLDGHDTLVATVAGAVSSIDSGAGHDSIWVYGFGHEISVKSQIDEGIDDLYFMGRGDVIFGADPSSNALVVTFTAYNDSTQSTVRIEDWYSANNTYQLNSIRTATQSTASAFNYFVEYSANEGSIHVPKFLTGSAGDDHVIGSQQTAFESGNDTMRGGAGADTMEGRSGSDTLYGEGGKDELFGGSGEDILWGGKEDDELDGGIGVDFLYGEDGNDTLKTFDSGDTLDGGADDDTYIVQASNGVSPANSVEIRDASGLDKIQVQAAGADYLKTTFRRAGNDLVVEVRGAADGNPVLEVLTLKDMATPASRVEMLGILYQGSTTIHNFNLTDAWNGATTTAAYVAAAYKGSTTGGAYNGDGPDNIQGTAANEILRGGGGNDTINGGGGVDQLYGDSGNDGITTGSSTGFIDGGSGNDTLVISSIANLGYHSEWRVLTLAGVEINGAGNPLRYDSSRASIANALLDPSNRFLLMSNSSLGGSVQQLELRNLENWSFTTASTNHDLLLVRGTNGVYRGDAGSLDALYADWSSAGADITWVNDPSKDQTVNGATIAGIERMIISTGSGNDRIDNSNALADGGHDDISTGAGNDWVNAGKGNDLLSTGNGNDILIGGAGNDTLIGGAGDDLYDVDSVGDVVTELVGEGTDTVQASVTHTLGAHVENLVLTGAAALNGTGNTLDNHLTGNSAANTLSGGAGNDTLDGGAGNDTLVGGSGDDTYIVESAGDVVTELSNEGTDTVRASVSYTLGNHVENLVLAGSAFKATGNALANILTGTGSTNVITGLAGADVLTGGGGADHFVDSAANLNGDRITDLATDDFITITGVRFSGARYNAATGVLELDTAGNNSFATRIQLPTGLSGEFLCLSSPANEAAATQVRLMPDTDGDGVADYRDNAIEVFNPDQRDTDGDGYANEIDADFNQDGEVDIFDLALMDDAFFGSDATIDMNGDGVVDIFDLALLDDLFGQPQGGSYINLPPPVFVNPPAQGSPGVTHEAVAAPDRKVANAPDSDRITTVAVDWEGEQLHFGGEVARSDGRGDSEAAHGSWSWDMHDKLWAPEGAFERSDSAEDPTPYTGGLHGGWYGGSMDDSGSEHTLEPHQANWHVVSSGVLL